MLIAGQNHFFDVDCSFDTVKPFVFAQVKKVRVGLFDETDAITLLNRGSFALYVRVL